MGRVITLSMAVLATIGGTSASLAQTANQGDRQAFDASIAHTRDALHGGVDNLDAAIGAANEAYTHLPNEVRVKFVNAESDVIAIAGGQRFHLTPGQFSGFMRIGKGGQFDAMSAGGGAIGAIREITSSVNTVLGVGIYESFRSQVQAVGKKSGATPQASGDVTREITIGRDITLIRTPGYNGANQSQPDHANPVYQWPKPGESNAIKAARAYPNDATKRQLYLDKLDQQDRANAINSSKPLVYPVR